MSSSGRLSFFTESVIRETTRLSDQYGAINMSQGMPDFAPPSELIQSALKAIKHGSNQYSITWGDKGLREAIARKAKRYNGIDVDAEKNVTVTCGSTEAVASAVFALTNAGDRIVITDPFYENYGPDAILAGCKLLYVPFTGRNLALDEERLIVAMSQKPKLLILNTPNNPTGRVLDKSQLQLVADLCEEKRTIAITDEIYEHIIYDGKRHLSLATIGDMHDRTVTVSAASKTYSVTGWRVGWALAAKELTNALRKIHDYFTICAPAPFQEALTTALNFPATYYTRLAQTYDRKRQIIMRILDSAGIEYRRPEGAYYILADTPKGFKDGEDFGNFLLKNLGVAVLPAIALYHDEKLGKRKVRLAFCKKDVTLQQVGRKLERLSGIPKQTLNARRHS